jgi:hypothetical protein
MEPGKASRKSSAWLHAEDFKDFRQRKTSAWSWLHGKSLKSFASERL